MGNRKLKAVLEATRSNWKPQLLAWLNEAEDAGYSGLGDTDVEPAPTDQADAKANKGAWKKHFGNTIASLLDEEDDDAHALAMKLMKCVRPMKEDEAMDESQKLAAQVRSLEQQLDAYKVKEALDKKRDAARKLLKESGLPNEAVTEVFLEALVDCQDARAMTALIEDRRSVVGVGKGKPKQLGKGGPPSSYEEFCAGLHKPDEDEA